MWIHEALTSPPRYSRFGLPLAWVRSALLTLSAISIGQAVDSLLHDVTAAPTPLSTWPLLSVAGVQPVVGALWLAGIAATLAALAGGVAEALPGWLAGREEKRWRRHLLETAIDPDRGRGAIESKEGVVVEAATTGVEKTANYRASFLIPTLGSFTSPLIIILLWILLIDPLSGVVLVLFIAAVPLIIVGAGKVLRRSNAEYRRRQAIATHSYLEMLEGLGTFKVLGAMGRARAAFAKSARTAMQELTRLLARNQSMIVVNDAVFSILMSATAVALVLYRLHSGAISPGSALAGVLVSILLYEPIDRVGRTFYIGLAGRSHRDGLVALAGRPAPDTNVHAPAPPRLPQRRRDPLGISLRGINVHLGGQQVIHDVNLDIAPGAHVALIGPSGSGKTTLLRVIAGLEEYEGQVFFNGQLTDNQARRGQVFIAQQTPGILSTTVADNLRIAKPSATDAELAAALRSAHLWDEVAALPGGLASAVGDRGAHLSGGQRRRLALARAFLRPSSLMLLDEPTADVDRTTEYLLHRSLAELTAGTTTITVAHRLDAVMHTDYVVVLNNGRVIASGTPAQLRESEGYLAAALDAEALDND